MENIWRSSSFITHPFSVHPSCPRGTENLDYSTNSENETMKRSEADRKFQNDEANSEAITRFNFWSRREGRQRGIEPRDGIERGGEEGKRVEEEKDGGEEEGLFVRCVRAIFFTVARRVVYEASIGNANFRVKCSQVRGRDRSEDSEATGEFNGDR